MKLNEIKDNEGSQKVPQARSSAVIEAVQAKPADAAKKVRSLVQALP